MKKMHEDAIVCKNCGAEISQEEYDNNGGFCDYCVEEEPETIKKRKNESKVGTSKQYNSGYDAAKSSIKSENDILYSVKDIKDLAKDFGIEGKDADKFVKGYQAYTDEWYDCHDSMDEDVRAKAKKLLKALDENALTNDELVVKILTPDGYFDEYGNPNGEINGMEDRLQEIDEVFNNVGAQVKWDVYSDPEAGIEGDDFQDTGFRFVTVAQLKAALDAGVDESEIAVYSKVKDESEYTEEDIEHAQNPYDDSGYDPNEEYRIYDVLSLVYDADEPMTESRKRMNEEEQKVSFHEVEKLLKAAKDALVASKGNHYEPAYTKFYCGGGANVNVSLCNSDEGMVPLFYAHFEYEDDSSDVVIGTSLVSALKELFTHCSEISEMEDGCYIDPAELQRLHDIANGQQFLFEAKTKMRSGWKHYVDNSDPLARRESLKWLYDKCSWEYLDDFADDRYDADADYDRDGNVLNKQDLIDCLTEVNWCFSGVSDLADFLRECSRENLPKARERIVHLNKLLGIK